MASLILALSPFALNLIMGGIKWLAGSNTFSRAGKRGILAVLAIIGAYAIAELTETPVDVDSLTSWAELAFTALLQFFSAHGTYKLLWDNR